MGMGAFALILAAGELFGEAGFGVAVSTFAFLLAAGKLLFMAGGGMLVAFALLLSADQIAARPGIALTRVLMILFAGKDVFPFVAVIGMGMGAFAFLLAAGNCIGIAVIGMLMACGFLFTAGVFRYVAVVGVLMAGGFLYAAGVFQHVAAVGMLMAGGLFPAAGQFVRIAGVGVLMAGGFLQAAEELFRVAGIGMLMTFGFIFAADQDSPRFIAGIVMGIGAAVMPGGSLIQSADELLFPGGVHLVAAVVMTVIISVAVAADKLIFFIVARRGMTMGGEMTGKDFLRPGGSGTLLLIADETGFITGIIMGMRGKAAERIRARGRDAGEEHGKQQNQPRGSAQRHLRHSPRESCSQTMMSRPGGVPLLLIHSSTPQFSHW